MEFKHTKGQWELNTDTRDFFSIQTADNVICSCIITEDDPTEDLANARLIVNAPEMLEALLSVSEYESFGNHITEEVINKVNNVIKLAVGRTS